MNHSWCRLSRSVSPTHRTRRASHTSRECPVSSAWWWWRRWRRIICPVYLSRRGSISTILPSELLLSRTTSVSLWTPRVPVRLLLSRHHSPLLLLLWLILVIRRHYGPDIHPTPHTDPDEGWPCTTAAMQRSCSDPILGLAAVLVVVLAPALLVGIVRRLQVAGCSRHTAVAGRSRRMILTRFCRVDGSRRRLDDRCSLLHHRRREDHAL